MKTELVDNIANEAIYQLQYYKNLNLAHKKFFNILFKIFSTTSICLIAIHVYSYLQFE